MVIADRTDPALEVDFDHNAPISAADLYATLQRLVEEKPIAYNRAHGGYWIVSSYDAVREVYTDVESFSSLHDGVEGDPFAKRDAGHYPEDRTPRGGISIPPQPVRFVPTEADPPMHTDVRRLEAPFFTPKAVRGYEADVRRHTTDAIDAVIERGRIDFVSELTMVVPTKITCRIIGLDPDDWEDLSVTVHAMGITPMHSPDFPMDRFRATQRHILELVSDRKREPREDVASNLVQGSVLGVPVEPDEAQTILNGLTFASTDTTATTMLHALQWLARNPRTRERLRQDLSLLPQAIEEFLRLFTPGTGLARTVTRDMDFHGHQFKEGDRVYMLSGIANRDPRKFPNPLEVDIDRENAKDHIGFGAGPHKCLGAPVARLEMRIMFEEILRRLPDFVIDEAGVREYPHKSGVIGFDTVPATFTPGQRVAAS
jgi:cytochrome P450